MRKRLALAIVAVLLLLLAFTPAAADEPEIEYVVAEETLPFAAWPGYEDSTRLWGVLDGAGYRIEIPADWNGELVMWAHGYRGTGTVLFFNPEELPFREYLLENGYAWAMSTYSRNDYDVEAGIVDTNKLRKYFRSTIAKPERTYIAGVSMGGHITAATVEIYRRAYDGALPVCGVVGDFELFDFFLDFNVAAQQIALGTSQFPVDPAYPVTTAQTIKAELEAVPGGWPVVLNEDGERFKQLVELRSGGDRPNFDEAWFFWNSFPESGSGIPGNFLFDLGSGDGTLPGREGSVVKNIDVFYHVDLDPGYSGYERLLNRTITRVRPDRGARRYMGVQNVPAVRGRMRIPVLTMHNLGDLFVPYHNEVVYAQETAARGNSHLLVQRAIRGVGHCGFTVSEYETAFADLVNWVETGERPAGDVVLDPAAVAAPDYGCQFTDFDTPGGHTLATPCAP